MAAFDADVHQNDQEFNLEINSGIKSMPWKKKSSFQYEFCYKEYLSSGSLKRHTPRNHPSSKAQET